MIRQETQHIEMGSEISGFEIASVTEQARLLRCICILKPGVQDPATGMG